MVKTMGNSGGNERRLTPQDVEDAGRLLRRLDAAAKRTKEIYDEPGSTPRDTGSTKQASSNQSPDADRLRHISCNENAAGVHPDFGPTAPSRSRRGFVVGSFTEHTEGGSTARREGEKG